MNASRLLEIVTLLLEMEDENSIQSRLNEVATALSNLVSSPTDPGQQRTYASSLDKLKAGLVATRQAFKPAQIRLLEEITADRFYTADLAGEIAKWVSEAPATPAVAQGQVAALVSERNDFVQELSKLKESLETVGVKVSDLQPGEAEIGFLLPRPLFNNELEKLITELGVVRRIVRAFMEAATGSVAPIEVRQISTSDPLFFFGLDPVSIGLLGGAVNWALAVWHQVEAIRKVRAETAAIPALKDGPINKQFEEAITKTIEKEIAEKATELVSQIKGGDARKNEQKIDLEWALEAILARVERGMTVEMRMLPPPKEKDGEGNEVQAEDPAYEEIDRIAQGLVFPEVLGEPVLKLTTDANKPEKKPAK